MNIATLQRHFAPLLRPAGAAYRAAMRLRAARYAVPGAAYRPACPVISVGNIAWGGTGKTPVVDYLLGKIERAGLRAVVLTRGYRAAPPSFPFPVTRNSDPAAAGDEPLLLARRHTQSLVLVDPKRARAAAWAERHDSPHLFLLDDGMQHLAVARDLNLVLLRPGDVLDGWNLVIPAGAWREGESALARADIFCMKLDAEAHPDIVAAAERRLAPFRRPVFFFDLQPAGLARLLPDDGSSSTAQNPDGKAYTLMCGTGDPDHVRRTAARFLRGDPAHSLVVRDHHRYTAADAAKAAAFGLPVVCTAKDAVKLAHVLPAFGDVPVWVLEADAAFRGTLFTDETFDAWLDAALRQLGVTA